MDEGAKLLFLHTVLLMTGKVARGKKGWCAFGIPRAQSMFSLRAVVTAGVIMLLC